MPTDNQSEQKLSDNLAQSGANLRGALDQVKMIATGGMAQIFRARQPSLDRYIVVKKLREELLHQPEVLERFRREAKALASVLHQNVAHVYDFVESGVESYILMEYIEGIDLFAMVQKIGALPPDIAASILLGVAKGVSFIHAHHLIHRDIKPANIRITSRGSVKLMDFGIVMDTADENLTRPGMMVGSPSYLSPEQVLGDTISDKADQFLLGICLYEILTGSRPFKEENGQTIFQRIREARYVPARKMNAKVPAALDKIITRLLKKSPNDRYDSVKDLITDLEKFLGHAKASQTEDLILQYVDNEALLTPAVPYSKVRESSDTNIVKQILIGAVIVAIAALSFFGGYWLKGMSTSEEAPSAVPSYNAPKAMKPGTGK